MVSSGTVLLLAHVVSAAFMLPFAWLFLRQDTRGSSLMALGAFSTSVTAVSYAASLVVESVAVTLSWYLVYLLALSVASLVFFSFVAVWTDRRQYLRPAVLGPLAGVMLAIPLGGLVDLALSGVDLTSAYWAEPGLVGFAGLTVFERTPGPVVLLWRVLTTVTALVTLWFLTEFTVRPEQRLYRRQNGLLVGGLLTVIVLTTVVQLLGIPIEVVPLTYLGLAAVFAVAIGGFGHFDVVPLATDGIVEEIDVGVLAYDTQGRVLDANRNALEALAVSEPAGRSLQALVAASPTLAVDADGDLETLETHLDGHKFTVGEGDANRRYSVSVSTIRGARDRVVGRSLLFYDITEQHRRQERLEAANARLEQFANVLSHDLRNPIQVARGRLELAREGDEDSFDQVAESLERMDEITEDVLTLARVGDDIDEAEPVAVEPLARRAWSHVATPASTIVVATDATIRVDRTSAGRLFENLFRNAVEHGSASPHSHAQDGGRSDTSTGVTVTVGIDDGVLYVEDDGPGIPADRREQVFEYGHSTDGGTGFGLAIVRDIAEAHGWSVRVTDGTDGGARFEFSSVTVC